jgi:hypothetical protein
MIKTFTIKHTRHRNDRSFTMTGTVAELVEQNSYTLECGASYCHEKGNKKINRTPTTIKSLLSNLNNAENNSAANGYSGISYTLVD